MPIVTKDQTSKTLNMRMKLPDTRVALQCMEEEFKESGSTPGNFHIHRTWQVIEQPTVIIDGQEIDLLGYDLERYTTTVWGDGKGGSLAPDHSKVKQGLGRVFEEYEKIGNPLPVEGFDTNNPPLEAKGKVVDAVIGSKEEQAYERPTPEQIAKGQKQGDKKMDENGKPVMIFKPYIAYILHPSKVEAKPL